MFAKGKNGIRTLDDFDFTGKTTLVRIDINTPINPKTGELIGERRFLSHKKTLQELIEKKVKIVIMAHQGRPGDPDFTTFEKHAEKLSQVLNHQVKYIPAIFGLPNIWLNKAISAPRRWSSYVWGYHGAHPMI